MIQTILNKNFQRIKKKIFPRIINKNSVKIQNFLNNKFKREKMKNRKLKSKSWVLILIKNKKAI